MQEIQKDPNVAWDYINRGLIKVNLKDNYGKTALMIAAYHGKLEVAKVLLQNGANINLQNTNNWTALMFAAEKGHDKVVELLLTHSGILLDKK